MFLTCYLLLIEEKYVINKSMYVKKIINVVGNNK